jgi:XTP/dITP diphosphohydrolase
MPWDRKQTIQTLRTLSIEELYELIDAIITEDWQGIRGAGDIMLHLVFYAKIAQEQDRFTLVKCWMGSVKTNCPSSAIYGDTIAESEEDVKNWSSSNSGKVKVCIERARYHCRRW